MARRPTWLIGDGHELAGGVLGAGMLAAIVGLFIKGRSAGADADGDREGQ